MDITQQRSAWCAALGVIALIFAGAAVPTWLAALNPADELPAWPALTFTALTFATVYVSIACLARWWPVNRKRKNGWPANVELRSEAVGDQLRLAVVNPGAADEFSAQVVARRDPAAILDPMAQRQTAQNWTIPWREDNSIGPKRILAGGVQVLDFARYDADAVNAQLRTGQDSSYHWWFSAAPEAIGARYYNLLSQKDLGLQRFILVVRIMSASSGRYLDWQLTIRIQDSSIVCEIARVAH
jgi:hypothetical protein